MQFASNPLQRAFLSVFCALVAAAAGFSILQNSAEVRGGQISLPKLLWLFLAVTLWFVMPVFLALDRRISKSFRIASGLFFMNMFGRGIVELWMMYVSLNWSPYYGIAHDLFSMLIIVVLFGKRHLVTSIDTVVRRFYLMIFSMFPFEIFFAWYMKTVIQQQHGSHLYFVADLPEYCVVLDMTWFAVILVTFSFLLWIRRWLY